MTRNKSVTTLKGIEHGIAGGSFGGGGGDGRLEHLKNFVVQGGLSAGQVAYWDGLHWTNDVPDLVIGHWLPNLDYKQGVIVEYNGRWWKCINRNTGQTPSLKTAFWRPIEMDIVRWQPDTAYPVGQIVLVPWDLTFFQFFDPDALASARTDRYTLWVAKSDIPATAPIPPGEHTSVCRVPPGMFIPEFKDPGKDAGAVAFPNDWSPITSPAFYVVDTAARLMMMDTHGPVVYGTLALVTTGVAAGTVFEYRNNVSAGTAPAEFVERRCWHSIGYIGKLTGLSKYIDEKVAPLISGIQHGASVIDIAEAPIGTEVDGARYIIGKKPHGDFAGHANQVAFRNGGAWLFGKPGQNEAHLNEKDNVIYHWSGTEWNKIGSVASGELKQLTDVDLKTKAPVKGDILEYNGNSWVNKTPEKGPIIKTFNGRIGATSAPAIITLEQDNFRTLQVEAVLEIRDIASHVTMTFLTDADTYALVESDCFQASQHVTFSSSSSGNSRSYTSKQASFWTSDARFGLTWMPGATNGNDQISVTNSPYTLVRLNITRMYDNYMLIEAVTCYGSYANDDYVVHTKYMFGNVAGNSKLKKIQFNVENTARIAANGVYTLVPWV